MNPRRVTLLSALPLLLLLGYRADAQMPRTISYQGVLADASGNFIPDGPHSLSLKLYESPTSSTPVYSENHTNVPVVRGVFNLTIGSVTPIPAALAFDRAYFLGVSVDGGTELAPRIALTAAPYAFHAAVADRAKTVDGGTGGGGVTNVNGITGAVRLRGSGATTVNRNGDTIIISSSGGSGGSGIQGVQSPENTLLVIDANGPVASLDIANGAVTSSKLGNSAVTNTKLADGSISNAKIQDSAITSSKIVSGAITKDKIAPGVGFAPTGTAGGDLSGSYPNPIVGNNAITTVKIDNDAITTAKIANGTITGADINNTAALTVASVSATGNGTFGGATANARLAVKGSGNGSGTTAADISNSAGQPLLTVLDNGAVGIGANNPTASLEINGGAVGAGLGLLITNGGTALSFAAVQAAPNVQVPPSVSVFRITDDGANFPIQVNMPPGVPGQILIISNDDLQNPAGVNVAAVPIAAGQARMFVFNGVGWRLLN